MYNRLIIDGKECDLPLGDFPFSISYQVTDEGFIAGSSSKRSITLPATSTNDDIFGDWGGISNDNGNAAEFRPFTYEQGGVTLFKGLAELQSAPLQSDRYRSRAKAYKVDLYGDNADWFLKLKDKLLRDFTYDTAPYLSGTVAGGWVAEYPAAEFGFTLIKIKEFANAGAVAFDEFTPFLFIRTLIDKALDSIGYTLQSSFLNSNMFKRLIMPLPLPERYPQEFSEDYLNVTVDDSQIGYSGAFAAVYVFPNQTVTPLVGANPYNNATGVYTAPFTGFYEVTLEASLSNIVGAGADFEFVGRLDGTPSNIFMVLGTIQLGPTGEYTTDTNLRQVSNVLFLNAGQTIDFAAFVSANGGSFDYTVEATIVGEAAAVFGSVLDPKYLLRDYSVAGLFKGLQHMFNLRFEADTQAQTLRIEPADDFLYLNNTGGLEPLQIREGFYQDNTNDVTQNLDISRDGELYNEVDVPEVTRLMYQTEGETEEYLDENEVLGFFTGQYTLPSNRFNAEIEDSENPYFAKTLCTIETAITADDSNIAVQIPLMYPVNYVLDPTATEQTREVQPRILYHAGLRPQSVDGRINVDLGPGPPTTFTLPFSFMVNYNSQFDVSLSYATEKIRGIDVPGLLEAYWLQQFARTRIGKKLETYYFWDILSILGLSFRTKLFLDGRLYVLQQVDGYKPLKETPTKTVLLLDQRPEQEDEDAITNSPITGQAQPT